LQDKQGGRDESRRHRMVDQTPRRHYHSRALEIGVAVWRERVGIEPTQPDGVGSHQF
jgi:hypothetical protein